IGPALIVGLAVLLILLTVTMPQHSRPLFGIVLLGSVYLIPFAFRLASYAWQRWWLFGHGVPDQLVLASYAIANGGIFGRMLGSAHLASVPLIQSDMVLAAVAEETGLVGSILLLSLAWILLLVGVAVGRRLVDTGDTHSGLAIVGLV